MIVTAGIQAGGYILSFNAIIMSGQHMKCILVVIRCCINATLANGSENLTTNTDLLLDCALTVLGFS